MSARWGGRIVAGCALAAISCRSAVPPKTPASFPPASNAVPDSSALAEGRDLAAKLFGRDPLTPDTRLLRYVAMVGRTVTGRARADAYRFAVTQSDLAYATAFPGGIVVVSRGLVFLMKSEAALAVALSREICRADSGGAHEFPRAAAEGVDSARESALDACGARLASAAGYDAAAFLHFFDALEERATSVREKSDLDARRGNYRALPETTRGGKLLAERFRSSAIL